MKAWRLFIATCSLLLTASAVRGQVLTWNPAGMGGGGALFLPSFDPHHRQDLYLSCDMGEIFHSTDLGISWSVPDFRQIGGGDVIGRIAYTSDPNVMYAISRNGDRAEPRKSTDGGASWKPLGNDPTDGGAYFLAAVPTRSDRILLTDYTRLFLSTDGGATFTGVNHRDEGYYVAGIYVNGEQIYLCTSDGIRYSGNGGLTWSDSAGSHPPAGEAFVSFIGATTAGELRFFAVTLGEGDVYPGVTGSDHALSKGVYKLDKNTFGWRKCGGIPTDVHPFFIAGNADDNNLVYVAGGSDDGAPTVYKSTDAGTSWSNLFRTRGNANIATGWSGDGGDRGWSYGEYALGFTVDPADKNRAIITDLGFAHLTTDGGATWRALYVPPGYLTPAGAPTPNGRAIPSNGLENTTCWQVAWIDQSTLVGCYSDIRGTRSEDGGATWSQSYTGHTLNSMYRVVLHPTTSIAYAATSSVHDIYQSTRLADNTLDNGAGQVLFSGDKGKSWSVLHDFHHPVIWLALDPARPNRLYASVIHGTEGGIYVSDDIQSGGGSTWRRLAAPPRTEGHPFNIQVLKDGALLASYSGRRAASGFTASSGVFLSTDGGATWSDRSSPQMLYWTKDVVVDPHDAAENTWYVGVFSGWGGAPNGLGGLYRTTDRGLHWGKILDLDRVTSCTVSPSNPDEMYATTEVDGLWHTANLRSDAPVFTSVAEYPFRQPERVFFDPYRAGEVWVTSFGNGLRHGTYGAVPLLISPPMAGRVSASPARLLWHAVANATGYDVRVGATADLSSPRIDSSGIADTTLAIPVEPGLTYFWRVRAVAAGDTGTWSPTWYFTVPTVAGLAERDASGAASGISISAAPNPASSSLTFLVTLRRRAHATLRLVNMLGVVVDVPYSGELEPGSRAISVDASQLTSGHYRYELLTDDAAIRGSIVIAR